MHIHHYFFNTTVRNTNVSIGGSITSVGGVGLIDSQSIILTMRLPIICKCICVNMYSSLRLKSSLCILRSKSRVFVLYLPSINLYQPVITSESIVILCTIPIWLSKHFTIILPSTII